MTSTVVQPRLGRPTAPRRPLVLVIDADPSARSVLSVALSRDGFDVWSTGSAAEGLALCAGRTPEAVVLEADLGTEDGFAVCAQLRGEVRTEKVPVVVIARRSHETEDLARVVGADVVVGKPAFARDVVALVRLELERRGGATTLDFQAGQLSPATLLRALLGGPRSGRMVLADGRGAVVFRDGRVIDARLDGGLGAGVVGAGRSGLDALVRCLMATRGTYTLVLERVLGPPRIQCTVRELVGEVFPRLQRWMTVQQRSVPLEAVLEVNFARLAQALATLPEEVNRVVQLFDGFRAVQQVLIDSPYEATLTLEVATRLFELGVIVPHSAAPVEGGSLGAPRFFEPRAAAAEEMMKELFAADGAPPENSPAPGEPAGANDWYEPPRGAGLDGPSGDDSWRTEPISVAANRLGGALSPDLARQLDAFNIRTEIEPRQLSPTEEPVARFARGDDGHDEAGGSLEQQVDEYARESQARLPIALTDEIVGQARGRSEAGTTSSLRGRNWELRAPHGVPKDSAPEVVSGAEAESKSDLGSESAVSRLEAEFFAEPQPRLADAEQAIGRVFRIGLYALVGLVVLVLAFPLYRLLMEAPQPELEPAPVQVFASPMMAAVAPRPELEAALLEEVPAREIDISEPLADAVGLYEAGEFKRAIATLEQVVTDEPKSVAAWVLLAQARYDATLETPAREAVEKVLELDPANIRGHILRGVLLRGNDQEGARRAFEKAVELDPEGTYANELREILRR